MPHPVYALLGIVLLSAAMGATEDRTARERLFAAGRTLLGWLTAMIGGGWLMRWIHG